MDLYALLPSKKPLSKYIWWAIQRCKENIAKCLNKLCSVGHLDKIYINTPAYFSLWYLLDCFNYEIYSSCMCVPLKEKCTNKDIFSEENCFFNKNNALENLWQVSLLVEDSKRFFSKNTNLALNEILSPYLLASYCNKARSVQNVIRYHQCSSCYKTRLLSRIESLQHFVMRWMGINCESILAMCL